MATSQPQLPTGLEPPDDSLAVVVDGPPPSQSAPPHGLDPPSLSAASSTATNLDRFIPVSVSQHSTTSRRVTFRVADTDDRRLRFSSPLSSPAFGGSHESPVHDEHTQQPPHAHAHAHDSTSSIQSYRVVCDSGDNGHAQLPAFQPASAGSIGPSPPISAASVTGVLCPPHTASSGQPRPSRRSASSASAINSSTTASLRLDYSARDLSALPPEFAAHKHASRVKAVDLSRNNLSMIPSTAFDRFTHLRRLNLTRNRLELLSTSAFTSSYTLAWLDISNNPTLTYIDPYLFTGLRALRHLSIANCGLMEIPGTIGNLVHLTQLSAFGNRLETVPKEIGEMRHLTRLDFSGNRIGRLPVEIGRLASLEWLNLNENQLSWLPDEMSRLINLRELGLASNRLESLPDLSSLQNLTSLIAYRNRLTTLPNSLATMVALIHLDLSRNRLVHLPPALFAMPNLRRLFLQGNRLDSLPGRFRFSHNASSTSPPSLIPSTHAPSTASVSLALAHLDLSNNQLTCLPWPLVSRPLKSLRMYGNPLLAAPPAGVPHATGSPLIVARTRPALGQGAPPPRLVTLALNGVLASYPMYRAARALPTEGAVAQQVAVRVFGLLRGDGALAVASGATPAGTWVPHRRCDWCLRLYVTDRDAAEMMLASGRMEGGGEDQQDGLGEGAPLHSEQATGHVQQSPWYTAVLLCPRVLPDHRDVPCEYSFCSRACWANWKPAVHVGGFGAGGAE